MRELRFGEPVELPWWVLALSAPPALVAVAGVVVGSTLAARALAIIPAIALIAIVVRVAMRVQSANMQSVWISLAYGIWAIFPVAFIVLALGA